jgi:hypothetical protein
MTTATFTAVYIHTHIEQGEGLPEGEAVLHLEQNGTLGLSLPAWATAADVAPKILHALTTVFPSLQTRVNNPDFWTPTKET